MAVSIDLSDVTGQLAALHRTGRPHRNIAVVVPLEEGWAETVRELFFSEEGPPFDPAEVGLERHDVFLTEREAIFIFETNEGARALEQILTEPDFLGIVSAWQRSMADKPRLGACVYEWPARQVVQAPLRS